MKSKKTDQKQPDACLQESVSIKNESSLESALKELATEAELLFKVLDATSSKIHQLETSLSDLKAHFPFQLSIKKQKSLAEKFDENSDERYESFDGYYTITYWYLSWEPVEGSKNYRLFLKSEKKEFLFSGSEEFYKEIEYQSELILKRPLVETDLATRLQFIEYLNHFVIAFKDYLKGYRISIETCSNSFSK